MLYWSLKLGSPAALGLDLGLGVLHVDASNRDSLALDILEPVRPQVDAYLLDWITRQPLRREWFFEQRDGNCRLMAALAVRLADLGPSCGASCRMGCSGPLESVQISKQETLRAHAPHSASPK